MNAKKLHISIAAVCPIDGVNSNRVITFKPEATELQKQAAQAIADSWDFDSITPADIAEVERSYRQQKALEVLPEILSYIAAKADAPVSVKDKAAEMKAVRTK